MRQGNTFRYQQISPGELLAPYVDCTPPLRRLLPKRESGPALSAMRGTCPIFHVPPGKMLGMGTQIGPRLKQSIIVIQIEMV